MVDRSPEAGAADASSAVTAIKAAINEISFFMQVSRKNGLGLTPPLVGHLDHTLAEKQIEVRSVPNNLGAAE